MYIYIHIYIYILYIYISLVCVCVSHITHSNFIKLRTNRPPPVSIYIYHSCVCVCFSYSSRHSHFIKLRTDGGAQPAKAAPAGKYIHPHKIGEFSFRGILQSTTPSLWIAGVARHFAHRGRVAFFDLSG